MTWVPVDVSNQKEVYAHFYIQVGTLKDPITKPIENPLNIVTTLVPDTDIFMLIILFVPHDESFLLPLPSYLFKELDKNQNREWL